MTQLWRKNVYRHKPRSGPWTLVEADAICCDHSEHGGSHPIELCVTARVFLGYDADHEAAVAWGEDKAALRVDQEVTAEFLGKMVRNALAEAVSDHMYRMVLEVPFRDGAFDANGYRPEPTT